jgi:lysophospholipase L1-like esterase
MDKKRKLKNIFVLFLSIFITLLVCEISYRFYEFYFYKRQLKKLDKFILQPLPNEPILQFKLESHSSFLWNKKILYQMNSYGLRDNEFSLDKKNTYRIIILGDSYTFGWGVPIENTYPKVLESLLKEKIYPIQVINAGIFGYNTQQEVLFFKKELLKLKPDLVIIGFFILNDTLPQGAIPMHPFAKHYESYWHSWFIEFIKSRINRFINRKIANDTGCRAKQGDFYPIKVKIANPCEIPDEEKFQDNFLGWKRCKEALYEIKQLSVKDNFGLYLIILPDFSRDFVNYKLAPMHKKVKEYAESIGIEASDFYQYFKGMNNIQLQNLEFKDGHPNNDGHRIIAEGLFLELKELIKAKDGLNRFRTNKLN